MSFFRRWSDRKRQAESKSGPPAPDQAQLETAETATLQRTYGPGDLVDGRFEVVNALAGGMGVVYLCVDQRDSSPVALKTFKPEYLSDRGARDRFLREASVWVNLGQHPHIVTCRQVLVCSGGAEVFLALDLVATATGKANATLRAWMAPRNPLSIEQALLYALHIARGMKHATTRIPGLVHRDLKPENVLVGHDRVARITDFGLASAAAQPRRREGAGLALTDCLDRTQVTQGGIVGTPYYMPPEQWTRGVQLDARTDVYAFGCILYEMVSGQIAVKGADLAELEQAHRKGRIENLPRGTPAQLVALVQHCLAADRGKRYATWGQLETAVLQTYRSVVGREAPAPLEVSEEASIARAGRGWSHHAIGGSYVVISKYDSAAAHFERALEVGVAENDPELEGAATASIGHICLLRGDARSAVQHSERALALARENSLVEVEGLALSNLGAAFRDLGDVKRATDSYEGALAIANALGNRAGQASTLNSLGNMYRRRGEYRRAMWGSTSRL